MKKTSKTPASVLARQRARYAASHAVRERKAAQAAAWRKAHPERFRALVLSHKTRMKVEDRAAWIEQRRKQRHREILDGRRARAQARIRANLSDGFVRAELTEGCMLSARDIPQALVEVQRVRLKIHRFINRKGETK